MILTAGVGAVSAGAMAMAIGEYVSVCAQADTGTADRRREEAELTADPESDLSELTSICERRGLPPELASEVAAALQEADPLGRHLRDELGQSEAGVARPPQAAGASAASFAAGAINPLLVAELAPAGPRSAVIATVTLVALCVLGAVGAGLGGAPRTRAAVRVDVGGALALAVT